jgi:hypothetical protein
VDLAAARAASRSRAAARNWRACRTALPSPAGRGPRGGLLPGGGLGLPGGKGPVSLQPGVQAGPSAAGPRTLGAVISASVSIHSTYHKQPRDYSDNTS